MDPGPAGPPPTPVLLFVDDEPDLVTIARVHFETTGWRVVGVADVAAAKACLARQHIDAVLSDLVMGVEGGLALLAWARRTCRRDLPFFLLTASAGDQAALALELGASGIFNKPCDWRRVVSRLEQAIRAP